MNEELIYDRPIAKTYEELQSEQKKTIDWVGTDKNVLEIGCHTGYLSCWLQKKGNRVTGLEYNQGALNKAKPYLYRAICGDIQNDETWISLGTEKYDVILVMHVLEHLVDPWEVLAKTKQFLKSSGEVIIALPNISNIYTRWDILKGNFNYEKVGVMDKTHLRFFNQKTARELIAIAGYKVIDYFCPWQASLFGKMRLLWRIGKYGYQFTHWLSPNLSDIIMVFRLKINLK